MIPAACSRASPASKGRTSIQPEGSTTNGENINHHMYSNNSAGVGQYDYTVSYEDPTSPLYVVGVQALILITIAMKLVLHCSVRFTPVGVYLTLLVHTYLPW